MKIRFTLSAAFLLAMATGSALAEQSGEKAGKGAKDGDMQAMMAAYQKAGTPGETHKMLQKWVGKRDSSVKTWMAPGQPPMESKGTAESKAILGDRFIQTMFAGSMMGQPFNGISTTGYDNVKKKLVSTWIDSTSTGIVHSEGTVSGKTINTTSSSMDPTTGKECKGRMVEKWESDNKIVQEFFQTTTGKEKKMMEIAYTRAK